MDQTWIKQFVTGRFQKQSHFHLAFCLPNHHHCPNYVPQWICFIEAKKILYIHSKSQQVLSTKPSVMKNLCLMMGLYIAPMLSKPDIVKPVNSKPNRWQVAHAGNPWKSNMTRGLALLLQHLSKLMERRQLQVVARFNSTHKSIICIGCYWRGTGHDTTSVVMPSTFPGLTI